MSYLSQIVVTPPSTSWFPPNNSVTQSTQPTGQQTFIKLFSVKTKNIQRNLVTNKYLRVESSLSVRLSECAGLTVLVLISVHQPSQPSQPSQPYICPGQCWPSLSCSPVNQTNMKLPRHERWGEEAATGELFGVMMAQEGRGCSQSILIVRLPVLTVNRKWGKSLA